MRRPNCEVKPGMSTRKGNMGLHILTAGIRSDRRGHDIVGESRIPFVSGESSSDLMSKTFNYFADSERLDST